VSKKISELLETGYLFDKIGFIEKAEGTVGLVTLMSSILININLLGILIRPKKRIFQDAIKGELLKGESILIISDLATSGITLFNAAKIVREHGGIVNYSMVVIDRLQGATENLARKGIQLFSLVSLKSLNETKRIQEYDIKEPVFQDFGGKSVTLVR
jgi:orotate phosphoribosyltransferase